MRDSSVATPWIPSPGQAVLSAEAGALRGARVLITGGAGLIGSHIADLLVRAGVSDVVVLDDFSRGRHENLQWAVRNGSVTVVAGDIRDRQLVNGVMRGVDLVFHQAAMRITQCAAEPRLAMDVMVSGTFNVLEAAAKARIKRVVVASSASVYGLAEQFPTPESHPPYNDRTLYGAAKTFAEGLLRGFEHDQGLGYVALRYFNVYGPRMDVHGLYTEVLIRWIERVAAGLPPVIFGDGSQTMDFIYVEDVARANLLAATANVSGEVFNVGSGVETSLSDLARLLLRTMESDLPVEHAAPRSINAVPRRLADTTRAREALGFEAQVSLEQGLRRLMDWWRSQRPRDTAISKSLHG
jgi:UDP-glucose 4-epimerase